MSDAPVQTAAAPAAKASTAEEKLSYRLVTGPDDRSFCERISAALAEGYVLHGSPAATYNGINVIVAQALVLPDAIASADAAVATAVDNLDADEATASADDDLAEEAFEGHA